MNNALGIDFTAMGPISHPEISTHKIESDTFTIMKKKPKTSKGAGFQQKDPDTKADNSWCEGTERRCVQGCFYRGQICSLLW